MKHLMVIGRAIGLAALFLSSCGPAPAPRTEPTAEPVVDLKVEEETIRAVCGKIVEAYKNHDAPALSAQVDESWENWEGTEKSRADHEKTLAGSFERQKDLGYNLLEEIGVVFLTPDVAIYKVIGEDFGMLDADGQPLPPVKVLEAFVMVKRDGRWMFTSHFGRPVDE